MAVTSSVDFDLLLQHLPSPDNYSFDTYRHHGPVYHLAIRLGRTSISFAVPEQKEANRDAVGSVQPYLRMQEDDGGRL